MERRDARRRSWTTVLQLIPALAFTALPNPAQGAAVTVRHEPFLGWSDAYRISNGRAAVTVVPAAGGRVLEFSLDGRQALWVNPGSARGSCFPSPSGPRPGRAGATTAATSSGPRRSRSGPECW